MRTDTEADGMILAGPGDETAWLCLPLSEPIRDDDGRMTWIEPGAVDLRLLATGRCPLLADHSRSVSSLAGVIDDAWMDGATLYGRVRFAPGQTGRETRDLVAGGFVRNISAGAWIKSVNSAAECRITSYVPYEISVVTIPKNWSCRITPGPIPAEIADAARASVSAKAAGSRASWTGFADALCDRLPIETRTIVRDAFDAELSRLSAEAAAEWGKR